MQNKDKIIKETAEKLGITQKIVQQVIDAQLLMARDAMLKKKPVTIYLRKVGSFISPQIVQELNVKRAATEEFNRQAKLDLKQGEEPTHFN